MRGSASYYNSRRYTIATPATLWYMACVCVGCWVAGYFNSVGYPVYGEVAASPLWNQICQVLPGKFLTYLIGFVLVIGGAFMVHRANYALVLIREKTWLPFFLYALLMSTNPDFFPLRSASVGVFCLILAIYQLFISYHDAEATENAFNASLLIGIGGLLWVHILWFIPLFWIGMYNFRSLSLKMFMASLLGVATVYWFVLAWCVWQHDFSLFADQFAALFNLRFLSVASASLVDWISVFAVIVLTLAASFNILTHELADNLRSRQYLSFLIVMVIWTFGLFFIYEQSAEEFLEMAYVPTSILIAHFFTVTRGKYYFWAFHLSVLLFIVLLIVRIWNF